MIRSRTLIYTINDFKAYFSTKTANSKKDYYEILKIPYESSLEDIKSAYYDLSKKYHPDKNKAPDANERFQDLTIAYETLRDFDKRKWYDLETRGNDPIIQKKYEDPIKPDRPLSERIKFDFEAYVRTQCDDTLYDKGTKDDRTNETKVYRQKYDQMVEKNAKRSKEVLIFWSVFITLMIGAGFMTR